MHIFFVVRRSCVYNFCVVVNPRVLCIRRHKLSFSVNATTTGLRDRSNQNDTRKMLLYFYCSKRRSNRRDQNNQLRITTLSNDDKDRRAQCSATSKLSEVYTQTTSLSAIPLSTRGCGVILFFFLCVLVDMKPTRVHVIWTALCALAPCHGFVQPSSLSSLSNMVRFTFELQVCSSVCLHRRRRLG